MSFWKERKPYKYEAEKKVSETPVVGEVFDWLHDFKKTAQHWTVQAPAKFTAQAVIGYPARFMASWGIGTAKSGIELATGKKLPEGGYTPKGKMEQYFLGNDEIKPWNEALESSAKTASILTGQEGKITPSAMMLGGGAWLGLGTLDLMPFTGGGAKKKAGEAILRKVAKNQARSSVLQMIRGRHGSIYGAMIDNRELTNTLRRGLTRVERKGMVHLLEGTSAKKLKGLVADDVLAVVQNPTKRLLKMTEDVKQYYDEAYQYLSKNVPATYRDNFVNHVWDIKRGSAPWRERSLPSVADGLKRGFKLKYDDAADLISIYDKTKINLIANKTFVDDLASLVDDTGMKMVQSSEKKGITHWQKISSPLLKSKFGGEVAAVHPDIYKYVRAVLENPSTSKAGRAYDGINAVMKKTMLTASLFHHYALMESMVASTGFRGYAKAMGGVLKNSLKAVTKGPEYVQFGAKHNEMAKEWVKHGLQISATVDVARGTVDNMLRSWETRAASSKLGGKLLAKGHTGVARFIRGANSRWDFALWDTLHTPFKLQAAENLYEKAIRDTMKRGVNIPTEKIRAEVAQFVNDTFGGQVWELLGTDKRFMKGMSRLLLSPDWTTSTLRQALSPLGLFAQDKSLRFLRRKMGKRFWTRAGMYYFGMMNALNYANSKRLDGQGRFIWDNEEGNKMNIFMGYDEEGKRKYVRMGKQFRELFEFIDSPIEKLGRKGAPLTLGLAEQFTDYGIGGFPQGWVDKSGMEEVKERAKHIGKKFVPLSAQAQQVGGMFQKKAGMTNYRAKNLMIEAIKDDDMDSINQVFEWALENNLDARKILQQAKSEYKARNSREHKKKAKKILLRLRSLDKPEQVAAVQELQRKGDLTPEIEEWIEKLMVEEQVIGAQRQAFGIE